MPFPVISLLVLMSTQVLHSQQFDNTPIEKINSYLVTVGPGDELYSWWGHTAIIIEDTETGVQRLFDYGIFAPGADNFVKNFAFGRLLFYIGTAPPRRSLTMWASEDRDIRIQTLNLEPGMKRTLIAILEHDSSPEHNLYLYDHYFDNCATKERDALDTAVGGELREVFGKESNSTLRRISKRYMTGHPVIRFLLLFLLGPGADMPITLWDEMFLPEILEKYASSFSYSTESGKNVPLLENPITYSIAKKVRFIPETAPDNTLLMAFFGFAFAGILFVFGFVSDRGKKLFRVLYKVLAGGYSLVFGILGSLLFFMMFFTDHSITYSNENVILANPVLLLSFGFVFTSLREKPRSIPVYTFLMTFLSVLGMGLCIYKLISGADQDNWEIILFLLPTTTALGPLRYLRLRAHRRSVRRV